MVRVAKMKGFMVFDFDDYIINQPYCSSSGPSFIHSFIHYYDYEYSLSLGCQ